MDKKNKMDVVEMMSTFQNTILNNKPNEKDMYDEVRMMRFKVKPVHGDLSVLNINNHHFMEILWSLGKMDEFFQANAGIRVGTWLRLRARAHIHHHRPHVFLFQEQEMALIAPS